MSSQAEKDSVICALINIEHPVIVELGAHIGEEYEWLKNLKPFTYLMVEPDPENIATIESRYSVKEQPAYYALRLRRCAISNKSGTIGFYVGVNHESKNRASGSTHRPTGHLQHFPQVAFNSKMITVPCFTLDDLAKSEGTPSQELDHIDLLWCDIQGAERDMIEGGRATLRKTRYMMIEAEEVELYEGQALRPELLTMLPDWEVIKEFGANLLMRNTKYGE